MTSAGGADKPLIDPAWWTPPPGFDPEDVAAPPLSDEVPWRINSLAIDASGSCNMACRYCAEATTQPPRSPMTLETLDTAWPLLFPAGRLRGGTTLRFGSGEPLLALPLLRRLAELLEQNADPASTRPEVFITTNGTLIDDEIADWLAATGWHIKVSLDGPAAIHNRWRVMPDGSGTHAQISKAVVALAQRIPDRFSVTAVLCRGTDPREVFESIADLGVKRIELVPAAHQNPDFLPDATDVERYATFVQDHARRILQAEHETTPTLVRFANRVARVMGYDTWRIQCGAGRSFYGVGPEGDLYPCFRFIGLNAYRLGHVNSGVDETAAAAFRSGPGRAYDRREPCRNCWAAPLCGGPCFACAEMFGPGHGAPFAVNCAYVLADAHAAVRLVEQLREQAPERLLAFLPAALKLP